MAVQQGRCINFGRCPKADSAEVIHVSSGWPFICPFEACGETLELIVPRERSPRLRPYLLIAGLALLLIVGGVLEYPWHSSAAVSPTREGLSAGIQPAATNAHPTVASEPDACRQTDWVRASSKDFLAINCVGKGLPTYDKRLEYVYSLNEIKNWSSIKRGDPRLQDCAGIRECEKRAEALATVRSLPEPVELRTAQSPPKTANWVNASCESVTASWESEDPRLSTSTCGGLGLLECSHIKRCLGLHDINVGPGSSKIEP